MNMSLKTMRMPADQAAALTVARLDYDFAVIDEAEQALESGDAGLGNALLDELVQAAVAKAEDDARARGYQEGVREGRDRMERELRELREELARETEELHEAHRREHELERALHAEEHERLRERMHEALTALSGARMAFESAVVPRYEEVGRDLAGVVLALVEDLVGRELATEGAHVVSAVTRALAEIPGRSEVTVALHPQDIDLLAEFDIDLTTAVSRPVTVIPDGSVDRHGAIVSSESTQVDAQIRSSVERLREALAS